MATSGQVFTISGISGEFLKDHDLIGKQDPYVIFEHGHQKVETSVSKSPDYAMHQPTKALASCLSRRRPAPARFLRSCSSAVKSAGLNATWTETYTLEAPAGQGAVANEAKVMVYNKNLLAGMMMADHRTSPDIMWLHMSLVDLSSFVSELCDYGRRQL